MKHAVVVAVSRLVGSLTPTARIPAKTRAAVAKAEKDNAGGSMPR